MGRKCFALFLSALFWAVSLPALAAQPDSSQLLPGIDISRWQGDVDFQAVADSGIQVVYIRSSYGFQGIDKRFRDNERGAREAGLHMGFYHYVTAQTIEEARRQAAFFAQVVRETEPDCRLVMDFEVVREMSREDANAVAVTFLEEAQRLTGREMMVYSDAYNANHVFDASVARWPLWVAEYGPEEPTLTGAWRTWAGFQYTDRGSVPGIRGEVDRDHFTQTVLLEDNPPTPGTWLEYRVVPGDTLWAIARRYHTTVAALAEENQIPDPNRIYPGQVLRIPVSYQLYVVQRGDTLSQIARQTQTTVAVLVHLNQISDPNRIYVGQVLRLPV